MKKSALDIKTSGVSFRTTAILATAFALTSAVQAALLINEDFEAPAWSDGAVLTTTGTNGWGAGLNATSNGTVAISGAEAHNGTQSLFLLDNDTNNYSASAKHGLNETVEAGSLDFWIKKAPDYSVVNYRVDFGLGGGKAFDFVVYNPGAITGSVGQGLYIRNASGEIVTGVSDTDAGFTAGNWNRLNISFDKVAGSLSVSLNSVTVLSLTAEQIGKITDLSVSSIAFNAGYGGGSQTAFYLDDVQFATPSNIPEPSTWAVFGGVAALAIAFWARRRFV
ncbi:MAG: PEP-CTERM sorting domain-containing protein [Opitutaceae bacterium]|jgi:hypothetical protein|nr:PEP-CTERM sorting domain-containing protein [Opitutaceae bacterium]